MKPDARIIEDNIARLIKRAYVPALPAPRFRKELKRNYLHEWRRRQAPPQHQHRSSRLVPMLALAAGLLLIFFLGRALQSGSTGSSDAPFQRSQVLLAFESDPWRSANPGELNAGLPIDARLLQVKTSAQRGLTLLATDGSLSLGPNSWATIREDAGQLEAQLHAGSLDLKRTTPGSTDWRIQTKSGQLELTKGSFQVQLNATFEGIRAQDSPAPEARFVAQGWTHQWPADGDLGIAQGQPESTLQVRPSGAPRGRAPLPQASPEFTSSGEAEPSLRGRILGPDGKPITRFRVGLLAPTIGHSYPAPLLRNFESVDGRFLWEDLPAGSYSAFVHAQGHALVRQEVLLGGSAEPAAKLEFSLQIGASLAGYVFDAKSKDPIAGARIVSLSDLPQSALFYGPAAPSMWQPASTLSTADGSFKLEHLTPGRQLLFVSAPGFGPAWKLEGFASTAADAAPLEVGLGPGAEVTGVVLDAAGQPLSGARLALGPMQQHLTGQPQFQQVLSDAQGQYRATDLPVDMLLVVLINPGPGKMPKVKPIQGRAGQSVTLNFSESRTGTRLSGQLFDAKGKPLAFTNIALFRQREILDSRFQRQFLATTTDAQGHYAFTALEVGFYTLLRVKPDGSSIRPLGQVSIHGFAEQEYKLSLGSQRIQCQVLDAQSGLPLPDARVSLWFRSLRNGEREFGGSARVDAEGQCEFFELNAGEYWISANSGGEQAFQLSAPIQLEEQVEAPKVRLQLGQGGSLELSVRDHDGLPLAECSLIFRDRNGPTNLFESEALTDAEGLFRGLGLHPGRYSVLIGHGSMKPQSLNFDCQAGRSTTLHAILIPRD